MAITIILTKVKAVIFFFITLFKRALCCFHRRRYSSSENVPLTHVDIISNLEKCTTDTSQNWEPWGSDADDGTVKTVHQHIELYRKQAVASSQPQEVCEEQDFFDDMAPKITKQKKVILNTATQAKNGTSRLSVDIDRMITKVSSMLLSYIMKLFSPKVSCLYR